MPILISALVMSLLVGSSAATPVPTGPFDHTGLAVPDTTLTARPGDRVSISNFRGSVSVRADEGSTVRIQGPSGSLAGIRVERTVEGIEIRPEGPFGTGHHVDQLDLVLPRRVSLSVSGRETGGVRIQGLRAPVHVSLMEGSVTVDDVQASVDASTVDGDIHLSRIRGATSASTVDGSVEADGVNGNVTLHSVDERVTVRGASGTLDVESVDGDLTLQGIRVDRLSAQTVDGDIRMDGALAAGGRYQLTSHDGDVAATLDEPVNADVSVSTFDGDFTTDFPATVQGVIGGGHGGRMSFTIGKGGAKLALETFDGDVVLRRADH